VPAAFLPADFKLKLLADDKLQALQLRMRPRERERESETSSVYFHPFHHHLFYSSLFPA